MARTIDHVSGGRFVLGIGAGWFEPDYAEYGYAFGTRARARRGLAAALPRLRDRLERLTPGAVRGHLPLLIAGGGERILLRLVAEHADLWNCYGTPAEMAHKNAILDEHCAEVGRDPDEIERTVLLEDDEATLAEGYHEAGMTHLIVTLSAPALRRRATRAPVRLARSGDGVTPLAARPWPAGGRRSPTRSAARRSGRAVRARPRARARAARDVLAEGLHPAHAPLPRRLPLLHVRAAAAARRALLPDARRGARDRARRAAHAGCHEALFTLGDKPELRYRAAREELDRLGFPTTAAYLAHCAGARAAGDGAAAAREPRHPRRRRAARAARGLGLAGDHARDRERPPVAARHAALRLARQAARGAARRDRPRRAPARSRTRAAS